MSTIVGVRFSCDDTVDDDAEKPAAEALRLPLVIVAGFMAGWLAGCWLQVFVWFRIGSWMRLIDGRTGRQLYIGRWCLDAGRCFARSRGSRFRSAIGRPKAVTALYRVAWWIRAHVWDTRAGKYVPATCLDRVDIV